ncbi:MBOAT family O-acyltransferase [Aquimarina sp. 2304DJ70-9]|uniref:MBOAT family O-acyltransferase n=1 Tax=Aquimarina penaris TaxID=3231044 RepID=UPI0034623957
MLFNSLEFLIFLPVVFILYWYVFNKKLKSQNLLILLASYVFYGWWDWRFLSLIIFSSILDFLIGVSLSKTEKISKRKLLLTASILVNIGFLGFFKYYNFFLESFSDAFTFFGTSISAERLNIILPVGISFYTFQTLSYTIDVYKKKLEPTKDFIAFFAFVSFFPQLVAGPIERATNLLPQFYVPRKFEYAKAVDGLRQILWGLFKKIVIADNAAKFANIIFNSSAEYSGSTLALGAIFFAFQIYGDFSGYSDIAIGTSRLFGFNLMQNFAFPYFSRDIAEFWRRWHISLSTWFRDYLYIPLGGSRGGTWMKVKNTFIIFLVSGFWHGANWTFIVWGGLNALYFLPLMLLNKNRTHTNVVAENRLFASIKEVFQILMTFTLTTIAWVFFRAENITHAFAYLGEIFSPSLFEMPQFFPLTVIFFIILFVIIEWLQRDKQHALEFKNTKMPRLVRFALYYILIAVIFLFGGQQQEFIYFQF